jgi:radical SAM family uncharacterized protein
LWAFPPPREGYGGEPLAWETMALVRPVFLRSLWRSVQRGGNGKAPVIAGHKLLYRCNLECSMCPFWRREDENLLTVEDEVRMMKALVRAGVSFLGFEGGEPLLRRDLPEILEEAHQRFHTSVVTNGWLLRNRIRDIAPHLDMVFVSLDGIGELHDRLRGIPGSFDKAVEGIRSARGRVPVAISSTITNENMDHAEKVVALAQRLGVGVTFQVAYKYSTAENMTPGGQKLRETLEHLLALKEAGAPILESREYFTSVVNSWFRGTPWRCKPWMTMNVDPQGRVVLPCYTLREYGGTDYVWDVDVRKLWNTFDWAPYERCNKCALACYLEPSLFSYTNPTMIRERILDPIVAYLDSRMESERSDELPVLA